MTSAILNALTSKEQRFLARRNYRLTFSSKVQEPSDENTTSESNNDSLAQSEEDDQCLAMLSAKLDNDRHRKKRNQK